MALGASGAPVTSGDSSLAGAAVPSTPLGMAAMPGQRDVFAAAELAIVLSHYDLGRITKIQEFPRGSRRAPKLVLRADHGTFLLKRRATGRDDPFKVAFTHQIQLFLTRRQFPLPQLIGTKSDNNSMFQWNGAIYELFEFVKGGPYDNSLEATAEAGRTLALFHRLLREFKSDYESAAGSYHGSRSVPAAFAAIPGRLAKASADAASKGDEIDRVLTYLRTSYEQAAHRVNGLGFADWPRQIVHCDWHPGNMLFRGARVAAVIDYDAARLQPRIIDIANGALQFSIVGGAEDPHRWPEYLDVSRFKRFLRAYESVAGQELAEPEIAAIPWLMLEALITESALPIANTGSFARLNGLAFLQMVERKVRWLTEKVEDLVARFKE